MSGIEFLRTYRSDPELCDIASVVLTTSDEDRDRLESYRIGIGGYIKKPLDLPSFVETVRSFDLYWSLCRLP